MKSRRLISYLILLSLMPFLLAGCWDRRELEDQAFIITIGIDKLENNQSLITFRIGIPSKSGLGQAGGGGGGGGKGSIAEQASLLTTIAAPTIPAAMLLASGYIDRELSLLHTKAVIFGEEFARDGVTNALGILTRNRELRRNIFVAVAKGNAYEFLRNNGPDLEKSYSKYWEGVKLMESAEAIHPGTLLHQFITDAARPDKQPSMIYLAINKNAEGDPKEIELPPSFKQGKLAIKAGEIPRKGGNKAEYLGTAIFKSGKLIDFLNLTETRSLLMLQGNFKKTFYFLLDPKFEGKQISFDIKQGSPPAVKVSIKGDQISIKEELFLEGDLIGFQSQAEYASSPQALERLNQETSKELEQRLMEVIKKGQKLGLDIVGYGTYAKRNFLTNAEWENFDWIDKFKDAEINLKVNFSIRRTGMQGKQPEILTY